MSGISLFGHKEYLKGQALGFIFGWVFFFLLSFGCFFFVFVFFGDSAKFLSVSVKTFWVQSNIYF